MGAEFVIELLFFCDHGVSFRIITMELLVRILIILLRDSLQEKMLEDEHKLLAFRMVILEQFILVFFILLWISLRNAERHDLHQLIK